MTAGRLVWEGEVYISVEEAASCYGLRVTEVESWFEERLLAPPRVVKGITALPTSELDRIATIVRYTRLFGVDAGSLRLLVDSGVIDL